VCVCVCVFPGAGPIDHGTNALWIGEIQKILARDDAYIFAEPVDRQLYPECVALKYIHARMRGTHAERIRMRRAV
jgi:hypothetical protein